MIASCVLCCLVLSCGTRNVPVLVNVSHANFFVSLSVYVVCAKFCQKAG